MSVTTIGSDPIEITIDEESDSDDETLPIEIAIDALEIIRSTLTSEITDLSENGKTGKTK